jgi:hypothetical protein
MWLRRRVILRGRARLGGGLVIRGKIDDDRLNRNGVGIQPPYDPIARIRSEPADTDDNETGRGDPSSYCGGPAHCTGRPGKALANPPENRLGNHGPMTTRLTAATA